MRVIRLHAVAAALLVAAAAAAAEWAPNESLVSPQKDLLDPEFNQARAQFIWNSEEGKLWLGNIDRDTGQFVPPDGKFLLVDPDTMSSDDVLKTGNGCEWVWTADGDGIVYTKFVGRHSNANTRLGYARPLPDGTFVAGFLGPDINRKNPFGSETAGDPSPRITYVDKDKNHYWRELDDPSTEQLLPGVPAKIGPVRHVRGARAVIYQSPVNDIDQVFYRELDTGVAEQLTFDSGDKDQMWMWRAPEFGDEFVFITMAGGKELRLYRKTGGQWAVAHTIKAPRHLKIQSPEPFVYNGRSYAFMQMAAGGDSFASEIWIANLDAANPLFRRVSDDGVFRARTDPEVFVTGRGPLLYYNRRALTFEDGKYKYCPGVECSEGVYAADPGLGPQP